MTERDRLFFDLTWHNLTESEKVASCQLISGLTEEWLVKFFKEQNPDATYDYRAQVILMKEECSK